MGNLGNSHIRRPGKLVRKFESKSSLKKTNVVIAQASLDRYHLKIEHVPFLATVDLTHVLKGSVENK